MSTNVMPSTAAPIQETVAPAEFFDDTEMVPEDLLASAGMDDALSDDEFNYGLITCENCGNVWDVSKQVN